MEFKNIRIRLETGLHDINAARFVQYASEFSSEIQIHYGDMELNAKSLMGVLCMDLGPGSEIVLMAQGRDADRALDCLEAFLSGSKQAPV